MNLKLKACTGAAVCALVSLGMTVSADASTAKKKHAAAPAATSEMTMLREQVAALKAQVDQLSAAQAKAAADNAALENNQDTLASSVAAQSQTINTMPAQIEKNVVAALPKPKTDKIYYKGVTLTLGGFAAMETEYRSRSINSTIDTAFTKIPFGNSSLSKVNETRFSAQQSRISGLVEGNVSPTIHVQGYGEFDFLGAAQTANFNQSNSFNLRVRHLYTNVDWDTLGLHLLAGQNWSLATMNSKGITPRNEVTPPQIDAQYLVGFAWARQPQIRVTKDLFNKSLWLAVSAENPSTTVANATSNDIITATGANQNLYGGAASTTANASYPISRLPDLIVKAAYEANIFDRHIHTEAFAIGSDFYSRQFLTATGTAGNTSTVVSATNTATDNNVYGAGYGAGILLPVVPSKFDFQASVLGGQGVGRYATSGLPDVTTDAVGTVKPIHTIAYLAGLTFHVSPMLDIYAFDGAEAVTHRQIYANGTVGYGRNNLNNTGCSVENGTCAGDNKNVSEATIGFWHKPYIGNFGKVQWGVQFSHVDLTKFKGYGGGLGDVGGKTSDDMVFTSIRYYPF